MSIKTRIQNSIAEAVAGAKLETMQQEISRLQETIDFNDPGGSSWVQLGQSLTGEMDNIDINVARANSRYYARRDPLFGRAKRLTRNYTFGRGVSWHAKDDDVKEILQAFWDDPDNEILTRAQGQWELCDKLLVDGELFAAFFVNAASKGTVKVSLIEPEEILAVIPTPKNKRKIAYYYRQWFNQSWNYETFNWSGGKIEKDYYPDWNALASYPDGKGPRELLKKGPDPDGAKRSTVRKRTTDSIITEIYMTQVRSNQYGLRALPSFYAAIVWASTYKGFMEDRATLTLAAATFAFKQKIKGGAAAVARMVAQLGAATLGRYGGSGGRERYEGAQTMVENESASFEQLNFDTKAANARDDGRMIRQQVAAATDITEPDLTGDPSVGNLASMTAMNGPQLKGFESWQQLFSDFYTDVFNFVIRQAIKYGALDPKGKDLTVEVDFPPVVGRDLSELITAISTLISSQSLAGREFVSSKRLATYILTAFGETDLETALGELDLDAQGPGVDFVEPGALADNMADAVEVLKEALGRKTE